MRNVRILIIDDDPEFQDRARGALNGIGETRVISNANRALQVIPTWAPDVILLDLMLEDLDGFAFLDLLIDIMPNNPPSILCMIDGPGAGTRLLPVEGWPVGTLLRSSSRMQFRIAVLKAASAGCATSDPETRAAG